MKAFARKQTHLKVIPRIGAGKADFAVSSGTLNDSFRGWLDTIAPKVTASTISPRAYRLTVLDIIRVNHATIREGESHRIWPPSVLEKFKTADVIRESRIEHYQLLDSNLRRVS